MDQIGLFRTPGGHRVWMTYRLGTSDWNILTSGLTEDQYGLAAEPVTGRVLDVGAHIGSVTIGLARDHPEITVIAIEPVPDNLRLLNMNIRANGLRNVLVYAGAASRDTRPVPIRHGFTGSEAAEHNAFVGNLRDKEWAHVTTDVPGLPLGAFLPVDFIKIDCEGGEYAFLDTPDVAAVPVIIGEWHNFGGTKSRGDIEALLAPTHALTFGGPEAGPGTFRAVRRV